MEEEKTSQGKGTLLAVADSGKDTNNPTRINGQYQLVRLIGSGSFSKVFLARNVTNGKKFAVKMETREMTGVGVPIEAMIYKEIQGRGIPKIEWSGRENNRNIIVMELLGPSLEDLFKFCGRRFSIKTILLLAEQMIEILRHVHSKKYMHRDIKPDNFLMGMDPQMRHSVYLVDYGISKKYTQPGTDLHIRDRDNKQVTGSVRYTSINSNCGFETSRRDDLESLGYMLVYFARGRLPWQDVTASTRKQKLQKICEIKLSTTLHDLCQDCPDEFVTYLEYCRGLRFEENPNYCFLLTVFFILFNVRGYVYDDGYDWVAKEETDKVNPKGTPTPQL